MLFIKVQKTIQLLNERRALIGQNLLNLFIWSPSYFYIQLADSRIRFEGVLSTVLAGTWTLFLPSLISSIATSGGVGGYGRAFPDFSTVLGLSEIIEPLACFFSEFGSVAAVRAYVGEELEGAPESSWKKGVSLSGGAVAGLERTFLKVPSSTAWLLLNPYLLMPIDVFLLWAFLRAFSFFSSNFCSTAAAFLIWALFSNVALPRAMSHWSWRATI